VEWAVVEFAEALVFIGMLRWYFVRKTEEKESEGFSWNEVETWFLDIAHVARPWFRLGGATEGMSVLFHLFESVYD
jgi:hypothetical protein